MGEWSEYFEDFPEENPANWVNGQFVPTEATRQYAIEVGNSFVAETHQNLQQKMPAKAAEAECVTSERSSENGNQAKAKTSPVSTMRKSPPNKAETALLEPFDVLPLDRILVPSTEKEFASAVAEIKASKIVGFDSESKPVFVKGRVSEGPHIVQFATLDKAFIFQVHRSECHQYLVEMFQSEEVLKVGFGLKSDRGQIHKKFGVSLKSVLDLNSVFRKDGYRGATGVRAAVAIVFNKKFHKSKNVTTSNWALPQLTSRQLIYAANDAYAALRVLSALNG
jgi:hypothetical protein